MEGVLVWEIRLGPNLLASFEVWTISFTRLIVSIVKLGKLYDTKGCSLGQNDKFNYYELFNLILSNKV